jgi:hypothetical protein
VTLASPPDLSVVIVTRDDFRSIARPVAHVQAQTAADRIELVIVAPSAAGSGVDPAALVEGGLGDARVAPSGPVEWRGRAAAVGVRASRAPIVAFVENHSFPDPRWAESLLAAHRGPWAIVGPGVENANPVTHTSVVNFLLTYGRWAGRREPGEVDLLPFHNSAYKREWLDAWGERLGEILDSEYWLQSDIRARGGRLYLEPAARTAHQNETVLSTSLRLLFGQGRVFGHHRGEGWSPLRRAAYLLGAPAFPLLNLPRALRESAHSASGTELATALPSILLHLVAHGAGEAMGYLTRSDGDQGFLAAHEFSLRPEPAGRS